MSKAWKKALVLLCAALAVVSFFWRNVVLIILNFALAMFLLKKGWLSEAVQIPGAGEPRRCPQEEQEPPLTDHK